MSKSAPQCGALFCSHKRRVACARRGRALYSSSHVSTGAREGPVRSGVVAATPAATPAIPAHAGTRFGIIGAISFVHLLNDMMQSVIITIYPLLKSEFALTFVQIGMITLTFQLTASLLQPLVGMVIDRRPLPYSLPVGMCFTLSGLLLLSVAPSYPLVLLSVALIGCGSSVFHPESSRIARKAAGGRYGLAQSLFQIGGNTGQALGPLLAAAIILKLGRSRADWFALPALLAIVILLQVSRWYRRHMDERATKKAASEGTRFPAPVVRRTIGILLVLMFSKFFYLASISSYYEFYLIHRFGLSAHTSAQLLAVFLFAVAAGTLIGGPFGDHIGRKRVIWFSILGCAPFTLLLPHVGLGWTVALSVVIGLVLASAFPAIIVYAQDMLTHRIGMVSGLFYGFSFGMGGLGAAVLGLLADHFGIDFVYQLCALLPLLGLFAALLPDVRPPEQLQAPVASA
jgi:MFS transporter, FSR family, fosmidomycin resistance protein